MPDAKQALGEWFVQFARNRDLIHRKIERIEEKDGIVIFYKDREQKVLVEPFLGDVRKLFEPLDKDRHYALVVFNTKENFKKVVENWKIMSEFKFLTIYFANPLSQLDKKWIVMPYTHSRISEESSLKKGLLSMFETVEEFHAEDAGRIGS